ncbi:MAG: PadR family transcriptional regulator [Cyanobacteria bacterium P01_F01_bin.53]
MTNADLVVLSVLAYEGPMHGYELIKTLKQRHIENWAQVSRPQVYYSIRKLARERLLERADKNSPSQGPEKTTYMVSANALPMIAEKLSEHSWSQQRLPSVFTTWSALALLSSPDTIRLQLADRARFLKDEIKNDLQTLEILKEIDRSDARLAHVLIKMSIAGFETELDMLSELESVLVDGAINFSPNVSKK